MAWYNVAEECMAWHAVMEDRVEGSCRVVLDVEGIVCGWISIGYCGSHCCGLVMLMVVYIVLLLL